MLSLTLLRRPRWAFSHVALARREQTGYSMFIPENYKVRISDNYRAYQCFSSDDAYPPE